MIGRISSVQIYRSGLESILEAQARLTRVQEQVATGKRILTPSDDPGAAAEIIRLRSELNQVEAYQRNADQAIRGGLAQERTSPCSCCSAGLCLSRSSSRS